MELLGAEGEVEGEVDDDGGFAADDDDDIDDELPPLPAPDAARVPGLLRRRRGEGRKEALAGSAVDWDWERRADGGH